ncbi:universal stress protein [Anaerosphaera multitolerans]|uniref:Universal stress protein n=1 Tax=Anaerosphaera multitolerans TaxID=2487351 RepID=A0A437S442_9FIRM|nr:universal stress protein [Anaerosphaera multitolerans]RVU53805.1 universal stress protein [Anaerosphaera multitolerans]
MKILIPVDGSKITNKIVEKAVELGSEFEAKLILLTVIDESNLRYNHTFPILYETMKSNTENMLEELKKEYSSYKYGIETLLETGVPYKDILRVAEEEDVDLIVMGNRGLGAFSRTLLGSVSNKVLNKFKKSVLIIKMDLEDDDEEDLL